MTLRTRVRELVIHFVIGAGFGMVFVAGVAAVRADPRPRVAVEPGTRTRQPNPLMAPQDKTRFFIGLPGNAGFPWLWDMIEDPYEPGDPVPPGDVGGDGGIGEPCTNC